MFGKHIYCSVRFDDEKTYWYRTNEHGYKTGMKVIVPVSNNGLWKIGTVVGVQKFNTEDVPYPLTQTKGIVQKAGFFAQSKVDQHNNEIQKAKYPPIDISIADTDTSKGNVTYCTCARERDLFRRLMKRYKEKYTLIENYPISAETDIPPSAQRALKKRLKAIEKAECNRELDYWNSFDELMEELDQYN